VTVVSEGSPQDVTIAPNGSGTASLIDTYEPAPGALVVTKTITGPAAGQQGPIGILVSCGGPPHVFAFVIDAGTAAGSVPRTFDVPGGVTCVVAEVVDGSTSDVAGAGVGGQQVAVPPGGAASADLLDTFQSIPPPVSPTTPPPPPPPPTVAPPTSEPGSVAPTLVATGGGGDAGHLLLGATAAILAGAALIVLTRRRSAPGA